MESNSLPLAPELDVFPRLVRLLILGTLLVFVSAFVLTILFGVLGT